MTRIYQRSDCRENAAEMCDLVSLPRDNDDDDDYYYYY